MTRADYEQIENAMFSGDFLDSQRLVPRDTQSSETLLGEVDEIGIQFNSLKPLDSPIPPRAFPRLNTGQHKIEYHLAPTKLPLKNTRNKHSASSEISEEVVSELRTPFSDPGFDMGLEEDYLSTDSFISIAEQANKMIEQEQPQRAHLTHRMAVPFLDFTMPDTVLDPISLELSKERFSSIQREYLGEALWPGVQQIALRLPWSPFPAEMGKVDDNETIEEGSQHTAFFEWLEPAVPCENIQEPPRSRRPHILRYGNGLDNEEELAFNPCEKVATEEPPTEKEESSLAIQQNSENEIAAIESLNLNQGVSMDVSRQRVRGLARNERVPNRESILHDMFTTTSALSNFMFLNGSPARATTSPAVSPHFQKAPALEQGDETPRLPSSSQSKDPDLALLIEFPTIHLDPPTTESIFIISSALFVQRNLIRCLQNLYRSAKLVEQDLSSSLEDGIPDIYLENEADIILSPSTGLLWTTLPAIQQKSLPGQKEVRSHIRDRIASVALRYERLIVLVSSIIPSTRDHLDESDWRPLNKYDSLALVDLMAFSQSLEDEVQVLYVPGGKNELAQWMAKMMIKYRFTEHVKILEDSTLWELFLRRIGMNAYASQVILATLKGPHESSPDPNRLFGLSAFVDMTADQRIAMFERLLGGKKVLLRVNRLLDESWQ